MSELIFEQFHARNLPLALALRRVHVLIVGAGAVGSNVAMCLALMGVNITIVDPDPLGVQNLTRTKADREYLNVPKGLAVAATIVGLVPSVQRIVGLPHDLLEIPQPEVWNLVRDCNVVVAATGNDDADRLLNWICRHLGVALVVPSMWPQEDEILADLLVVPPDHLDRGVGCFECLRPPRPGDTPMLEAQEGLATEVGMVASLTAMTVIGMLLPDSDESRDLNRQLDLGVGYRILRRRPFEVIPVRNHPRPDCHACAALRERDVQRHPVPVGRGQRPPWHAELRARLSDFLV